MQSVISPNSILRNITTAFKGAMSRDIGQVAACGPFFILLTPKVLPIKIFFVNLCYYEQKDGLKIKERTITTNIYISLLMINRYENF